MAEPATKRRPPEGITIRHARGCTAPDAGRCRCQPAYQAQVFSPRDRRTIRKSFRSLADARAWRTDTKTALRQETMRAPTRTTLADAADDWIAAARAGIARTRSGRLYRAFLLKEELRVLYHLDDPRAAPEHLAAWLAWASRSKLKPFVKLARTVRRHREGILAAIRLGLSNGRLEGLSREAGGRARRSLAGWRVVTGGGSRSLGFVGGRCSRLAPRSTRITPRSKSTSSQRRACSSPRRRPA